MISIEKALSGRENRREQEKSLTAVLGDTEGVGAGAAFAEDARPPRRRDSKKDSERNFCEAHKTDAQDLQASPERAASPASNSARAAALHISSAVLPLCYFVTQTRRGSREIGEKSA
jgi:hypothetical protein